MTAGRDEVVQLRGDQSGAEDLSLFRYAVNVSLGKDMTSVRDPWIALGTNRVDVMKIRVSEAGVGGSRGPSTSWY